MRLTSSWHGIRRSQSHAINTRQTLVETVARMHMSDLATDIVAPAARGSALEGRLSSAIGLEWLVQAHE